MLEFASAYYDVNTFPKGETRRALERVLTKKSGGGGKNSGGYNSAAGGDDNREKKRRKKEKGTGR